MNNPSGIRPIEFNVLIKPDAVENKTAGGLYLSDETQDREKHKATRGTIVALSPMAFNEDVFPPDMEKPQPGQRVCIALHAGAFVEGMDGEQYRIVKDKDVTGLIG